MEDTLINFETAKLAKEKDFHWPVRLPYASNGNRFYDKVECNFNNVELICSAPTQSLLQKWLREVHNINVESNYLPNIKKYRCLFIPMTLKKPSEYSTPRTAFTSRLNYLGKENYNTYEKALEAGLQEALKLIK